MYSSVETNFWPITESLEGGPSSAGGNINYMLLDSDGRISTSLGIDFDGGSKTPDPAVSISQGLQRLNKTSILWKKYTGGPLATADVADKPEIEAEWRRLFDYRERTRASKEAWGKWYEFSPTSANADRRARLVAEPGEFYRAASKHLTDNETTIQNSGLYPNYDNWPADAQLGILLMAWNGVYWLTGPDSMKGVYKLFRGFLQKNPPDFMGAAGQSAIRDPDHPNNQSLARRSDLINTMFVNAQTVADPVWAKGYNKTQVYWPVNILRPFTP